MEIEIFDNGEVETAPTTGTALPWIFQLDYKAGKTPQNYAGSATPEVAGAKFHYYDKDVKAKIDFKLPVTLVVCDILSGISGTIEEEGRYSNFYSNKVRDTRNEALRVYVSGIDRPLITGLYSQIKEQLPKGAKYQMYLLCLEPTSNTVFLVTMGATLSDQLKRAIADRTNKRAEKISLFGLCDISTKWWFIQMKGGFQKVTKEGAPYEGKGDLYFVPEMIAGVFHADNNPQVHAICERVRQASGDYVQATQDRIWKADKSAEGNNDLPKEATQAPISMPAPPKSAEQVFDDLPF